LRYVVEIILVQSVLIARSLLTSALYLHEHASSCT
jgi:hypothetical protein